MSEAATVPRATCLRVVAIADGDGDLETTLIGLADEGIGDVVVCVGRDGATPTEAAALADHDLEPAVGETPLDAARMALAGLRAEPRLFSQRSWMCSWAVFQPGMRPTTTAPRC